MLHSEKIILSKPINLDVSYSFLFDKIDSYIINVPKIKELKNVFITHEGLVLKNGILVDGCAYNLKGKEDYTFYGKLWKLALEQYLVCKLGKSLPSIQLPKEDNYLLIHSKWFNYSFWLTDSLVRLWMAKENGWLDKTKLIVPEGWKNISFVQQSLAFFDIETVEISNGHHVFASKLIMPETRKWSANFYPPHIKGLQKFLLSKLPKSELANQFVYISRAKRGVRSIENEEELVCLLNNYNFTIHYMEELTFSEQIQLMQSAKIVISAHGAGLANIMFMKENSFIIEMMDYDFAHFNNPMPFWKLANAVNVNYALSLSKTPENNSKTRIIETDSEWRMKLVNNKVSANIEEIKTLIHQIRSV